MQENEIQYEQIWFVTAPSGCKYLVQSEIAHALAIHPGWLVEPRQAGEPFAGE